MTTGPITVAPYEVKQNNFDYGIPRPPGAGAITHMETDLVGKNGRVIPIERLMLHHIVSFNLGSAIGAKQDPTCNSITALDCRTQIPGLAERFYGAGEERAVLNLPAGQGYEVGAEDTWGITWMVTTATRPTTASRFRNLLLRRGATVSWDFRGAGLHDVTVASGPRRFSSPHRTSGARFRQKLATPGTYRRFCSLHPVAMTQRIVVR